MVIVKNHSAYHKKRNIHFLVLTIYLNCFFTVIDVIECHLKSSALAGYFIRRYTLSVKFERNLECHRNFIGCCTSVINIFTACIPYIAWITHGISCIALYIYYICKSCSGCELIKSVRILKEFAYDNFIHASVCIGDNINGFLLVDISIIYNTCYIWFYFICRALFLLCNALYICTAIASGRNSHSASENHKCGHC